MSLLRLGLDAWLPNVMYARLALCANLTIYARKTVGTSLSLKLVLRENAHKRIHFCAYIALQCNLAQMRKFEYNSESFKWQSLWSNLLYLGKRKYIPSAIFCSHIKSNASVLNSKKFVFVKDIQKSWSVERLTTDLHTLTHTYFWAKWWLHCFHLIVHRACNCTHRHYAMRMHAATWKSHVQEHGGGGGLGCNRFAWYT